MKQGKPVITFVMVAIAAMLCIYFGYHVFNTFNDPYQTTTAYQYTVNDSVKAEGLLVRREQVLTGSGGIVDVTRGEGEKVGVGQTVAMIYRDSKAQDDQAQLESLAVEIELLEHAVTGTGSVESAAHLDEDILQAVVALRSSSGLNDYSDLEDQVKEAKGNVLKRGYTYGDGASAAELSARLKDLKSQYSALKTQTATATKRVTAGKAGIFSTLVDGYETTLTPESALSLTPSALSQAMETNTSGEGIGKLITSDRWYFAALLPADTGERLKKGNQVTMRFTGDFTHDVDMDVEYISAAEGDQVVMVFSTDRYLAQTTLLRQQTAELIFESWVGLRVPKGAVHMVKSTYEDEKTGETVETSKLGVYVLVGGRAEFKPLEMITEGSDYYVVKATSTGSKALRAGDEIIIEAVGLYDGQLLEF